jgi:hypothetical protein
LPVTPEALIVASPNDKLACRLHAALDRRSRRVSLIDGPSAARLFTIKVDEDGAVVSPDIPLFMRASAWFGAEAASEDERFSRQEAFATLWAAAALCSAPVINRPSSSGSTSRLTISAIASRMGGCAIDTAAELYVSTPAMALGRLVPPVWGEDIDFDTREFSNLRPDVPARLRHVDSDAGYEVVSIVGRRAWAASRDPRTQTMNLTARSIEIVQRLKLHFATVVWMESGDDALPVRVNSEPGAAELGNCLEPVLEGLCQDLVS